jgi:hypothetical protein
MVSYGTLKTYTKKIEHSKNKKIYLTLFLILLYIFCSSKDITKFENVQLPSEEMYSTYLYITRHGEKITDSIPGLSIQGIIRSNCMVNYFRNFPLGIPNIIYAESSKSQRAIITATPLSIELDIPILVTRNKLLYSIQHNIKHNTDKIILAIMEHWDIVKLARDMGCTQCKSWSYNPTTGRDNNKIYNIVWILHLNNNKVISFHTTYYNVNNSCNNISYSLTKW